MFIDPGPGPSISLAPLAFGNSTFQFPRGSYLEIKHRFFQQVFIERKQERLRTSPDPGRFVCIGFWSSRTILASAEPALRLSGRPRCPVFSFLPVDALHSLFYLGAVIA